MKKYLTFIFIIIIFLSCQSKQEKKPKEEVFINITDYSWDKENEILELKGSTNFPKKTNISLSLKQAGRISNELYIKKDNIEFQLTKDSLFNIKIPFKKNIPRSVNLYVLTFKVNVSQSKDVEKYLSVNNLYKKDSLGRYYFSETEIDYVHHYEVVTNRNYPIGDWYLDDVAYNEVKNHIDEQVFLLDNPIQLNLIGWKLVSKLDSIYSIDSGFLR